MHLPLLSNISVLIMCSSSVSLLLTSVFQLYWGHLRSFGSLGLGENLSSVKVVNTQNEVAFLPLPRHLDMRFSLLLYKFIDIETL